MARPRTRIESRFPAVKEAAHDLVKHARDHALGVMEGEAEKRLERTNDSRGYNLDQDIQQETLGHQSGKIVYEPFYGRWFEYGTPTIQAAPFMRPAHRKGKKEFVQILGDEFEGWVRRRARVRRP